MSAGLEAARAAKAARTANAQTHECPRCAAQVVTYIPAELYHRCPSTTGRTLTRFRLLP